MFYNFSIVSKLLRLLKEKSLERMKTYSRLKVVWLFAVSIIISMADGAFGHETTSVFFDNFVEQEINHANSLTKINAVSDLAKIQPFDSAVQSLQFLVQRYGSVANYPKMRFQGNQAMTRYEFAADLSVIMSRINELIANGNSHQVSLEDLETLKQLQIEFAQELQSLQRRTDNLEAQYTATAQQQFSTTTKLQGEVIFAIAGVEGDRNDSNLSFGNRVRLNLDTSFTGKDRLRTRLQAINIPLNNLCDTWISRGVQ